MTQIIKDVVTWLKQWYYTEDEIDTFLASKANSSHAHQDNYYATTDSGSMKIRDPNDSTQGQTPVPLGAFLKNKMSLIGHTHTSAEVSENSALSHLNTSSGASQHDINVAIDGLIGSGAGGGVSLGCVSDFSLDNTDITDIELVLTACTGKLISSIAKTSTSGLVDTYTITYNDSTTDTFTVTNGSSGSGTAVIGTGSFSINSNGHLVVELPDGVSNPYSINSSGHLIYDTSVTNGGS